jgi:hypothetical protein
MRPPRPSAALLVALLAVLPGAAPAAGAAGGEGDAPVTTPHPAWRVTREQQDAIDVGLAWLARQQLADGSFSAVPRGAGGTRPQGDCKTAVTSLATLAFLGAGHGLRHGPYRATVEKAVDWMLGAQVRGRADHEGNDGYICPTADTQSKMHGHGFAALALAEAFAGAAPIRGGGAGNSVDATRARNLRSAVDRAVSLIERSQCDNGGWGYGPGAGNTNDHEGSVTVCQVQALSAAARRGFAVDMARVERARDYMRKSQESSGGFRYRLTDIDTTGGANLSYSLAAAGVVSLLGLGEYKREDAIEKGIRFLVRRHRVPTPNRTPYYFYGSFYAVQAFHHRGGPDWEAFWPAMRRNILADRSEDGSWSGSDMPMDLGPVYPTAMMLLCLEVPVGYLSIYAR